MDREMKSFDFWHSDASRRTSQDLKTELKNIYFCLISSCFPLPVMKTVFNCMLLIFLSTFTDFVLLVLHKIKVIMNNSHSPSIWLVLDIDLIKLFIAYLKYLMSVTRFRHRGAGSEQSTVPGNAGQAKFIML